MTTAIKLMNEDMTTRGGYQYVEGMVATADGSGIELCSDGLLHVYESLEQAVDVRSTTRTREELRSRSRG